MGEGELVIIPQQVCSSSMQNLVLGVLVDLCENPKVTFPNEGTECIQRSKTEWSDPFRPFHLWCHGGHMAMTPVPGPSWPSCGGQRRRSLAYPEDLSTLWRVSRRGIGDFALPPSSPCFLAPYLLHFLPTMLHVYIHCLS